MRNSTQRVKEKKKKKGEKKNNPTIPAEAKSWLATQDFHYEADETAIYAYPLRYADDMQAMQRSFNVLHAGIEIATIKGRDLIPAHTLALSTLLNREAFASCQVSLETALAYLRRESITLPPDAPRGYVAVVYKGFTLGWVKNLGTRANNLYPQEWRIRSPHNPENMVEAGVTAIE